MFKSRVRAEANVMTLDEPNMGAFVFRTETRYIFCSARREPNGSWSETPPCFALPHDAPPEELGAAVKKVVNASLTSTYANDVEAQRRTARALATEVAQVKSWDHLIRMSRSCAIRCGQTVLTLIPQESPDEKELHLLTARKVTVDEGSPFGPIGRALLKALA